MRSIPFTLALSLLLIALPCAGQKRPHRRTPASSHTHTSARHGSARSTLRATNRSSRRAGSRSSRRFSSRSSRRSSGPSSNRARSRSGKRSRPDTRAHAAPMDAARATSIQTALIKSGYLTGQPTGVWDANSIAAMQRLQSDNGWQTKIVPDSRALIKLGLGPQSPPPQ